MSIDHVSVGVTNMKRSKAFYDAALAPLGLAPVYPVEINGQLVGVGYGEPITVMTRREFSYTDSQVLGKEQEEQLLFRDMREDAATQIVRRLAALKPVVELPDAGKKP